MEHEGRAGLEKDIRKPDTPYIVKMPFLCDYLDEIMRSRICAIDHAFVPIRDLFSAAESRREVERKAPPGGIPGKIIGGLWDTLDPARQETVLMRKFYDLLYALAVWNIPLTLLYFPRLVQEPQYLYGKLRPVFQHLQFETFLECFGRTAQPQFVHVYR